MMIPAIVCGVTVSDTIIASISPTVDLHLG